MAEKYPDYMAPISDRNRIETFAVQFNNVIRSLNQAIIVYMKLHPEKYSLEEFPGLNYTNDDEVIYESANSIPMDLLLPMLHGSDEYDKDQYKDMLNEIRQNYDPLNHTYASRIEAALVHLGRTDICKHIYICEPSMAMYPKELQLLSNIFNSLPSTKYTLLNCKLDEAIIRYPDITTVFIESTHDLHMIVTDFDKKYIQDKFFNVSAMSLINIDLDKINTNDEDSIIFRFQSEYDQLEKDQICMVRYFIPYKL